LGSAEHGGGTIQVLLATWNGAAHLDEQLASVWDQTDDDFAVLARDDGSTDDTARILERHAAEHPGRMRILPTDAPTGSASGNFSKLMAAADAAYVAFCDQDDIWMPDRLARSREAMRVLERKGGGDVPLLVHSDLEVVDTELHTLARSFWRYQKLDPGIVRHLNRLIVQNVVTGCTCLANRALIEKGTPVPADAIMHDWWLALVACAFGRIGEVARPTVRYRQHGANDTGAKRWDAGDVLSKAARLFDTADLEESLHRGRAQAAAFLERHGRELGIEKRTVVEAWATMGERGFFARRQAVIRHGLFKIGFVRNLALLLRI